MSITSHTYPETLRNQSDKLQNPRIEFMNLQGNIDKPQQNGSKNNGFIVP